MKIAYLKKYIMRINHNVVQLKTEHNKDQM
jgi:hypothetical protein